MIAAGVCVGDRALFERHAQPSLARALPAGSPVAEITTDAICTGYNEALDAFGAMPGLQALILMHEDVTIEDPLFCAGVLAALAEPGVELVGVIGARDVRHLCWWEAEMHGRVTDARLPGRIDHWDGTVDVDCVDGLLMALSPWAVANLRFDDATFGGFHGYDVDFGLAVRAAGRRVTVAQLGITHHTRGGIGNGADFWAADHALRHKWADRGRPMAADVDVDPSRRRFLVRERG